MKVYRIEHREWKLGPYLGSAIEGYRGRYFGDVCPGPFEDGLPTSQLTAGHHFGFKCIRHLVTWFRFRDIFRMRKKGFRVYRYKVSRDHVLSGQRQVAFVRCKATVREEVPLSALARHLCTPRFVSLA